MRSWLVPALLVTIALWVPSPGAAAECWWLATPNTTRVGDIYIRGSGGEIWQETNGLDDLQRNGATCADGRSFPPDTCYENVDLVWQKWCIDRVADRFGL